jgi:hypothetical protein
MKTKPSLPWPHCSTVWCSECPPDVNFIYGPPLHFGFLSLLKPGKSRHISSCQERCPAAVQHSLPKILPPWIPIMPGRNNLVANLSLTPANLHFC